jgi:hypothetical protein
MLNMHERYKCGVPVIIEGETGVGKTFLLEMLSRLWNQSHLHNWNSQKGRIIEFIQKTLEEKKSEDCEACLQAISDLSSGEVTTIEPLNLLCLKFHTQLKEYLTDMKNNPMISLLTYKPPPTAHGEAQIMPIKSINELFDEAERDSLPETTAYILYAILSAEVKSTFHKINIHAALTPEQIKKLFEPAFTQARYFYDAKERQSLKKSNEGLRISIADAVEMPVVTVRDFYLNDVLLLLHIIMYRFS